MSLINNYHLFFDTDWETKSFVSLLNEAKLWASRQEMFPEVSANKCFVIPDVTVFKFDILFELKFKQL